jgi:hypothetical protein
MWHWFQGLVGVVIDEAGQVCAAVLIRLLDEMPDYESTYRHNPEGKICFVELAVAKDRLALAAAFGSLRRRHATPEYLLFERGERFGKPKLYPWKKWCSKWESLNGKF